MSAADYLAGLGWIVIVVGSHARVATQLQSLLVPHLSRAGARLAVCVLFLTSLMALGHLLGAVGWLFWWPMLICSLAVAVIVEAVSRRASGTLVPPDGRAPGRTLSSRLEIVAALGCVAAVGWQWTTHVADAFDRGMVQADNLWYHGPFMARFLQTGGFGDLGTLGYSEARYYPFDSELLHGLMSMPFGRDVVVPVANHLFAAMGLGAAFLIGRRWGVGALAVLATTVVASLPLVASTQPGQMYNDVMAGAMILASVALLLEGGLNPSCLAVAGASLGIAIGTKLSVVGVAAPLLLGVLVLTLVARRVPSAIAWLAATSVTGGFWFARNWIVHGSPAPFVDIDIGPVDMPASVDSEPGATLLDTLSDFDAVRQYYADSITVSFGPLWFAPALISLVACSVLVVRDRDWRFLAAVSAGLGLLTFPMLPLTGGLPFVNNLRYGVAALMLAMALSAVAVASRYWARAGLAIVCVASVVTNLASDHRARVEAWPGHHAWGSLAAAAIVVGAWWWRSQRLRRPSPPPPRRLVQAGAGATVVLVGIGGWFLQRHYLDNRYVDSGLPEDPLYRPFHDITGTEVDVIGTVESYAMFGPDLSNHVTVWNEPLDPATPEPADPCRFWRAALEPGAGYIAISKAWLLREVTAEQRAAWFGQDPSVITIVDDETQTVYYHDRALDPSRC